jgi:broad specificity phosphatase PhoE
MSRPLYLRRPSELVAALLLGLTGACASAERTASPPAPYVAPPPPVTTLYLVRHAERAPGQGDVSISDAGRLRALALRDTLLRRGVSAIVVSQFRRTAETAQPLADATGLPLSIRTLDLFDIKNEARTLATTLAREHAGRTVLVVGHSNTIPAMLGALTGTERADLHDRDYDGLYVVRLVGDQATVTRLRYGADDGTPDPAG